MMYGRCGGEVVTLRSAKPTCAGSIPARISAPIAQLVEQLPLKETVVGSNPTGGTWKRNISTKEVHILP